MSFTSRQQAAAVMLCLVLFSACNRKQIPMDPRVAAISGRTLSGKPVDSTFFLDKITLLNFSSVGSPVCIREINLLNKLHKEYSDRSFQILCIAANTPQQIKLFNSTNSSDYSLMRRLFKSGIMQYEILPEYDKEPIPIEPGKLSRLFQIDGCANSFLINASGTVVKHYQAFPADDPKLIAAAVMEYDIDSLLFELDMRMHYSTLYRFLPPKKP